MMKLSQWHDEHVRPIHKGLYQCKNFRSESGNKPWYCRWDGKFWLYEDAGFLFGKIAFCQNIYWRGIVKE